jgi:hypothetical protein
MNQILLKNQDKYMSMKYLSKSLKKLFCCAAITNRYYIFFGHRDIPLNELRAKYTNTASFVSVDGMDVHFRDEGNQTDTIPIVLIHVSLHTFFDI